MDQASICRASWHLECECLRETKYAGLRGWRQLLLVVLTAAAPEVPACHVSQNPQHSPYSSLTGIVRRPSLRHFNLVITPLHGPLCPAVHVRRHCCLGDEGWIENSSSLMFGDLVLPWKELYPCPLPSLLGSGFPVFPRG